jgi:hypothetical protein
MRAERTRHLEPSRRHPRAIAVLTKRRPVSMEQRLSRADGMFPAGLEPSDVLHLLDLLDRGSLERVRRVHVAVQKILRGKAERSPLLD